MFRSHVIRRWGWLWSPLTYAGLCFSPFFLASVRMPPTPSPPPSPPPPRRFRTAARSGSPRRSAAPGSTPPRARPPRGWPAAAAPSPRPQPRPATTVRVRVLHSHRYHFRYGGIFLSHTSPLSVRRCYSIAWCYLGLGRAIRARSPRCYFNTYTPPTPRMTHPPHAAQHALFTHALMVRLWHFLISLSTVSPRPVHVFRPSGVGWVPARPRRRHAPLQRRIDELPVCVRQLFDPFLFSPPPFFLLPVNCYLVGGDTIAPLCLIGAFFSPSGGGSLSGGAT